VTGPPIYVAAAAEADADALAALERRCHTHPWTLRHFQHALRDESHRVLAAWATGPAGTGPRLAGYCVILVVAGEVQVHNLAVDVPWRRQGLACRLLATALRAAAREGAGIALLEVRVGNREAIALYEKAGFVPVGLRRDYYDDPREDALVLRREGLRDGGEDLPGNS
jgi:ribosomal-protein-alanine N-acetyltransferase